MALTAAVALSAPAQAVTLSDSEIAAVKESLYAAQALCAETSDAVIPTSSSWFDWDAPTPNGQIGAQRCTWDLFECVGAGGRSVTFVNHAGFWGWQYWADTCNR